MEIIQDIESMRQPLKNTAVTIGTFDGVHIGHQKVIKAVVRSAKKIKGKSVVVTFYSHPHKTIKGEDTRVHITSPQHKIRMIEELGVDVCILLDFKKGVIHMSAEKFISHFLVKQLDAKNIYVGYNFMFGSKRKGDVALLEKMKNTYGYNLHVLPPVIKDTICVSSTVIRKLVHSGDLSLASRLLGRKYSLYGTVVKGDTIGRILGYPTANIIPDNEIMPPSGVYAVKVLYAQSWYNGVVNIGVKPTFKNADDVKLTVEIHIFNFNKEIYNEYLEIFFVQKLREEMKFPHKDELIEQIKKDEVRAKNLLRAVKWRGSV